MRRTSVTASWRQRSSELTKQLADRGLPPLPAGITPHSLRRTFCSLLYALGETRPVVMQEMGHTDPALALKVYAQTMRRDEGERAALRRLVDGAVIAQAVGEELVRN